MSAFRRVVDKINETMADLSASQRLVIGLCAVIIAGSLMWLTQWSTAPEYVRLLEEPLAAEQIAAARDVLPAGRFKIVGRRILVRPEDRHELLWLLEGVDALPSDTSLTFESLIQDDSPFRPESENDFRRNVALQSELAKVIASSQLIKDAEVFITREDRRRVGAANVLPSASIKVTMARGQTLDQEMVKACAAMVSGAVPGLAPHRVSVIDGLTLRTYSAPSPEDSFAQGLLKETMKREEHLRDKALDQLSYIPGVRVAVSVELDADRQQSVERLYNDPAVAEDTSETKENRMGIPGGEPGVGPNVAQSLTGGGTSGIESSERVSTTFQNQQVAEEKTTVRAPYAVQRAMASVGIPRSYVVGVLMVARPEGAAPTDEEVAQQFETERQRVRGAMKSILMADNDSDVTVEIFHDMEPAVTVLPDGTLALGGRASSPADATALAMQYLPEGGLVLLAVVSLFLMMRTVSKAAAAADKGQKAKSGATPAQGESSEEPLTVAAGPIGRVEPSHESLLEARELDGSDLKANQIAEQVEKLVEQDPEGVAQLVQRWADAAGS